MFIYVEKMISSCCDIPSDNSEEGINMRLLIMLCIGVEFIVLMCSVFRVAAWSEPVSKTEGNEFIERVENANYIVSRKAMTNDVVCVYENETEGAIIIEAEKGCLLLNYENNKWNLRYRLYSEVEN